MTRVGAAGQIVRPRSLRRALFALLRDRIGGLWRWRELTLPLALLYVAWAEGGGAAASALCAALVGAAALLLLFRPEVVLTGPQRCLARTRAHARRRRWPDACVGLHWYRRLPEGSLLIPELLSWREREDRISVTLRPLPEQPTSSWDAMADAFRRFVGGASVEWRESFGTLRIVVGRVGLPDVLAWRPQRTSDGRLIIGRRHGGLELALDPYSSPHVLLAGATGSGKGALSETACVAG